MTDRYTLWLSRLAANQQQALTAALVGAGLVVLLIGALRKYGRAGYWLAYAYLVGYLGLVGVSIVEAVGAAGYHW